MTLKEALRMLRAELDREQHEANRARLRAFVMREAQAYSDRIEVERFLKRIGVSWAGGAPIARGGDGTRRP